MSAQTHRFARRLVLALACAAGMGAALAQGFPNKPVTLMVPYPPGGVSDVIARTLNNTLAKHLGQPVIVENLGGANGAIAAQKVLSSPADGYIIFQGSPNELILGPLVMSSVKFKSEDFRLVQAITVNPLMMFGRKDLPASNGDELLAYATKAAKEGKPLTYASVGPGSLYHLLGEHLSKVTGIPMTHVPYKGGAPAVQDLMAGQVDVFITPYGKAQIDMVAQGRLKAVAALSAERQSALAAAAPLQDAKGLNGFVFDIWAGFFVHKDTPEAVVQVLSKALGEVANDPAVRASLEAQSMIVPRPQPLAAMSKFYSDGTAKYRAIAKSINLQPQ